MESKAHAVARRVALGVLVVLVVAVSAFTQER